MPHISKDNLQLTVKALKSLIDRVQSKLLDENDAIKIATETKLISPVAAENGAIYTDENGVIYTL